MGSGIVRDNVTGLEWQQSTVSGITSLDEAIAYCNGLTRGDHFDWRLPTVKELSTLVDSSIPAPGPCIDTTFFPDTEAGGYWSSTSHDDYPGVFWVVGFDEGDVHINQFGDVRCGHV